MKNKIDELKAVYDNLAASDTTKKLLSDVLKVFPDVPYSVLKAASDYTTLAAKIYADTPRLYTNVEDVIGSENEIMYIPDLCIYTDSPLPSCDNLRQVVRTVTHGEPQDYFAFSFYVYCAAKQTRIVQELAGRYLGSAVTYLRDNFYTVAGLRVKTIGEYYEIFNKFLPAMAGYVVHAPNFIPYYPKGNINGNSMLGSNTVSNISTGTLGNSTTMSVGINGTSNTVQRYFVIPAADSSQDAPEFFDAKQYQDDLCVYFLQLKETNCYKYGLTANLARRLGEHRRGIKYVRVLKVFRCANDFAMRSAESMYKNHAITKGILRNRAGYTEVIYTQEPEAELKVLEEFIWQCNNPKQLVDTSSLITDPASKSWIAVNDPHDASVDEYYSMYCAGVNAPLAEHKFKKVIKSLGYICKLGKYVNTN